MSPAWGKYLMIAGALLLLAGIIVHFAGSKLGFLGRLPGDIRIERDGGGFYFPITTCILLSLLLTVIVRIVQWLMR
jgi:hypothetical protein